MWADLAHLVRYQNDGVILSDDRAHRLEQSVGFLGCEHRGWFVENENLGAPEQLLQNLDSLLFADRQLPHRCRRINVETVFFGQSRNPTLDLAHGTKLFPEPEHNVLGDGEGVDQTKVLVHHADAMARRIVGRPKLHRLAPDGDVAAVGPVEP